MLDLDRLFDIVTAGTLAVTVYSARGDRIAVGSVKGCAVIVQDYSDRMEVCLKFEDGGLVSKEWLATDDCDVLDAMLDVFQFIMHWRTAEA